VRLTFSLALAERTAGEMAQRAQGLDALVEGPVERPWNVRDLVVADPDGYLLVFTEPLDLASLAKVQVNQGFTHLHKASLQLLDIVRREPTPEPWTEGEKIPWDEPGFSWRMLQEHLTQEHDSASRRFETIDRHVGWIHRQLLAGEPAGILDLGCGPGLYTSRLAKLGHTCLGIDFSPASITYARAQAEREGLPCTYRQADIRTADYGTGHRLAMVIFGEFNVFTRANARRILAKAHGALDDGGLLLLEPHTFAAVQEIGGQSRWYTAESGLFSNRPHLCLYESFWDSGQQATTERYYIVDAASGEVTRHASTMQAYTDAEYRALLNASGFDDIAFYPSLTGEADESQRQLLAIVARKVDTAL
jgi:SAM-dependent methyltransferase